MAWSFHKTALLTSAMAGGGGGPVQRMKVWNGSAWEPGTLKVWDGGAWVPGLPKVWDGGAWI